jgi:hypothetical protein
LREEATVRTAGRTCLALLAGAVGVVLVPSAALADTASPPAVKTAWYWSLTGVSVEGNPLPEPPAQASLVADGSLGVAYLVDQEDMALNTDRGADRVSTVAFDLGEVPAGSTYSTFTLTMPLDAGTQLKAQTPDISACELISGFTDSPTPQSVTTIPSWSPASCVKGTFKDTIGSAGGYEFDLTAIANDWSGGAPAEGVLIRPTVGLETPQPPFAISFAGKNGILTKVEFTLPVPEVPPVVPGPVLPPAPPMPGVVLPPVTGIVQPPVVPTPAPQVQPLPTTPPQALAAYHQGALVPSGAWWLALLGVLGLLVLTAAVLGDPLAPAAVDPRRRRFAEVVRAQTRAPAAATVRRPAPRFRPA